MPPQTSRADFEALVRRAGLQLSDAQIADIHENAWPHIERMVQLVRGAGRDRSAEPAHTFDPENM
jgi:hypothetical protein